MAAGRSLTGVAAILIYLVAVHVCIAFDRPGWAVACLMFLFAFGLLTGRRRTSRLTGAVCLLAGIVLAVAAARWNAGLYPLYVMPVAINLGMAWLFARSLMAGREALLSEFSRVIMHELPAQTAHYTRHLTFVWAVFFTLLAIESALLAVLAKPETWSLFANLLNYVFVGVFLLGELLYRRFWLGRDASIWRLFCALLRTDFRQISRH